MKQAELLNKLQEYCGSSIEFKPAETYYWSPKDSAVSYQDKDTSEVGMWTLLHEVCHGLLKHKTYESDFELLLLEVSAWERAERLAKDFGLEIDSDHVQDCLDSHRDWQYKRSLCPNCDLGGVQIDQKNYSCLFCSNTWSVSSARFCRPYRKNTKRASE